MSGPPDFPGTAPAMPEPPEDLAAEYVLGCLDLPAMAEARRRLAAEPGFAREVAEWERRLLPLAALVAERAPPAALWDRLEQSLAGLRGADAAPRAVPPGPRLAAVPDARPQDSAATGEAAVLRRSVRRWRVATAASLALAAGVAAFALRQPDGTRTIAALAPAGSQSGLFLAMARPDGTLVLRAVSAVSVPQGRDLQLWSLPEGATVPASLGVLPSDGKQVQASPTAGGQLLVSLEPAGGSPTGAPTGPVVYSGRLITE
ncbi:MAG: anti-sigma factor [Janthinobacterium lividum]